MKDPYITHIIPPKGAGPFKNYLVLLSRAELTSPLPLPQKQVVIYIDEAKNLYGAGMSALGRLGETVLLTDFTLTHKRADLYHFSCTALDHTGEYQYIRTGTDDGGQLLDYLLSRSQ